MSDRFIQEDQLPWINSAADAAALPPDTGSVLVRRLDDEIAEALSRLSKLHTLYQDGNSMITDRGLKALGQIRSLRQLDLEWSAGITDEGLLHLAALSRLEFLDLGFCDQITPGGVRRLAASIPSCSIHGVAA